MFPDPSILTHPNIPKPLHTVNPRSIKGQYWWDKERQAAYAEHGYCCWACGVHKLSAQYRQHLEAHEYYDIDYAKGIVKLVKIVALCHSCHSFIHSGRLFVLYQKGEIGQTRIVSILRHGFGILKKANLKPFYGTMAVWFQLQGHSQYDALLMAVDKAGRTSDEAMAEWSQWRLVLDGKEYFTPFRDEQHWQEEMSKKTW